MTKTGKNGINHDERAPKFSTNSLVKERAEPCLKDLDQLKEILVLGLIKEAKPNSSMSPAMKWKRTKAQTPLHSVTIESLVLETLTSLKKLRSKEEDEPLRTSEAKQ